MNRRESLKLISMASLSAGFNWTIADVLRAQELRNQRLSAQSPFVPKFFSKQEYQTVRILVDLIIPADARSGSATDAGVPEFMDFMMIDRPSMQKPMREGLAWLDAQCQKRFQQTFAACSKTQRNEMLGDIAWPEMAKPEMATGVAFFNSFRDLTASGFWSSKIGVEDIQYMGNAVVPKWEGCPPGVLKHLGVSYEE